jgi:hypothetical protein
MKAKRAFEAAVRWSGRDVAKAVEIMQQQCELDPQLDAEIRKEARIAFVEKLIDDFLAKGYSLERPDELIAAVEARLLNGPLTTRR